MGLFTKAVAVLARNLGLTDPRLGQFLGGTGESYSGEKVTIDTALQLDTVWACVRLISQTIATLPLFLYQRDRNGQSTVADAHPLYRILHDQPNADMTATEFWEAMVACVLLWGNAYAQIIRGYGGRVVTLTPLRPDMVQIRRQNDGSLTYAYAFGGQNLLLADSDVFHIKGFSLDGLMGMSPLGRARQQLGAAIAAEKASASVFRNGMRPSGYVKAPAILTTAQRGQAKELIVGFSGAVNTGRTPLLEGGWSYEQLTIPPNDAQLLETRSFHVEQICRWFDVPPVMIGHMNKATAWGTGIEQMMLGFLAFSLRPHLKRIEQVISRDLLTPAEQGSYYAEFNVEGLLRADSVGRAALYGSLAQNGLRTRNELRALDNLPPLPGGDDLTVQSNLLPIEKLGEIATMPRDKAVQPGEALTGAPPPA